MDLRVATFGGLTGGGVGGEEIDHHHQEEPLSIFDHQSESDHDPPSMLSDGELECNKVIKQQQEAQEMLFPLSQRIYFPFSHFHQSILAQLIVIINR